MTIQLAEIARDLSAFADLGTSEVSLTACDAGYFGVIVRNGIETKLTFLPDGPVLEEREGVSRRHATLRALLASENFGDLGRWADSQQLILKSRVSHDTIPVTGLISRTSDGGDVVFLDDHLVSIREKDTRVLVALIDGPAGIGKTSLLRALALRRAQGFRQHQRSLLLHVESRGRMLQNLTDLMAFSLQTLRVSVTYDQVPALVRHGLITLAIDGFDELGDPNGYDLAWAQVNELIEEARGTGTVILAGRETFIGEAKILAAIKAIDTQKDRLLTFSLSPISPNVARKWLQQKGWNQSDFEAEVNSALFDEGSYALRPFFLQELAREDTLEKINSGKINNLLSFLVDSMITREAEKFGIDVETVSTSEMRQDFVRILMEEVSRDLADNQSVSISAENLSWLAEAVASGLFPESLWGILKNRSGVIAFLTDDDRRGYKRFIHEQVYTHFLSNVIVSSILSGETAKFVRRNIFGFEFLESFSGVVRQRDFTEVKKFVEICSAQIGTLGDGDRARSNLASFIISTLGVVPIDHAVKIGDVHVDEVWTSETVAGLELKNVTIGQFYARDANISQIVFDKSCYISTLIANNGTLVSKLTPIPSVLSLPEKVITDPSEIRLWMYSHLPERLSSKGFSFDLNEFGLFPLFNRLIRYKPYWLKGGSDEKAARKILEDDNWEMLKRMMLEHEMLVERYDVPASGPKEAFYHVRNRMMLTGQEEASQTVRAFLEKLVSASIDVEGGVQKAAQKLVALSKNENKQQ